MKRHYGYCSCLLGNGCLLRGGDIHDDAAFLHLCEAPLEQLCAKSQIFKLQFHEIPQSFGLFFFGPWTAILNY
jgi:hypothetical protein